MSAAQEASDSAFVDPGLQSAVAAACSPALATNQIGAVSVTAVSAVSAVSVLSVSSLSARETSRGLVEMISAVMTMGHRSMLQLLGRVWASEQPGGGQRRITTASSGTVVVQVGVSASSGSVASSVSSLQSLSSASLTTSVNAALAPSYSGMVVSLGSVAYYLPTTEPTPKPTSLRGDGDGTSWLLPFPAIVALAVGGGALFLCLTLSLIFRERMKVVLSCGGSSKNRDDGKGGEEATELKPSVTDSDSDEDDVQVGEDWRSETSSDSSSSWRVDKTKDHQQQQQLVNQNHAAVLPVVVVNHIAGIGLDLVSLVSYTCEALAPAPKHAPGSRRFEWTDAILSTDVDVEDAEMLGPPSTPDVWRPPGQRERRTSL